MYFRQVIGAIMMIGGLIFAPSLSSAQKVYSVCDVDQSSHLDPVNLTIPVLVMVSSSVVVLLLFMIFFNTSYKRLEAETVNCNKN